MELTTMAFQRRPVCCLLLLALVLSLQLTSGLAADVAVYWGRHRDEGSLREACDTGKYTTVIISFLAAFGHGTYRLDLSGHSIADVGADIKHCKRRGVLVLLSIGGQGGEYSLPTSQATEKLADYLWNAFLAGSRAGVRRPFGDVVVDGIDFYIDQGGTEHYDELVRLLHGYNKYYRGGGLTLTATPRCRYPDHRLDDALATGLFNRIHVRLYGEDQQCVSSPLKSWEKWAAAYPRRRVFVGVHAGYMSQKDLCRVMQFAKKWPNKGGIMIWNRYYDKKTYYMSGLSFCPMK